MALRRKIETTEKPSKNKIKDTIVEIFGLEKGTNLNAITSYISGMQKESPNSGKITIEKKENISRTFKEIESFLNSYRLTEDKNKKHAANKLYQQQKAKAKETYLLKQKTKKEKEIAPVLKAPKPKGGNKKRPQKPEIKKEIVDITEETKKIVEQIYNDPNITIVIEGASKKKRFTIRDGKKMILKDTPSENIRGNNRNIITRGGKEKKENETDIVSTDKQGTKISNEAQKNQGKAIFYKESDAEKGEKKLGLLWTIKDIVGRPANQTIYIVVTTDKGEEIEKDPNILLHLLNEKFPEYHTKEISVIKDFYYENELTHYIDKKNNNEKCEKVIRQFLVQSATDNPKAVISRHGKPHTHRDNLTIF